MTNQTAVRFVYPQTLIREYEHWLVLLREPQATLGSLVLCAKSGATEFSGLPMEAHVEMGTVIGEIEHALKAAFDYDKINYLMLMMVDPDVHFHVLPRYARKRDYRDLSFEDACWPGPPDITAALAFPASLQQGLPPDLRAGLG